MRWPLPVSPAISGAPLPAARIAADLTTSPRGDVDPEHCTRAEIDARVAACRACPHSTTAPACSACDLRCGHSAARAGEQLIARRAAICPDNRWPTLS